MSLELYRRVGKIALKKPRDAVETLERELPEVEAEKAAEALAFDPHFTADPGVVAKKINSYQLTARVDARKAAELVKTFMSANEESAREIADQFNAVAYDAHGKTVSEAIYALQGKNAELLDELGKKQPDNRKIARLTNYISIGDYALKKTLVDHWEARHGGLDKEAKDKLIFGSLAITNHGHFASKVLDLVLGKRKTR